MTRALIIGNSDGIGLALTRALLGRDWDVVGISRSAAPVNHTKYAHTIADVRDANFGDLLDHSAREVKLVIYCAGIGEGFDVAQLATDVATFEINLMGMVRTVARTIPHMVAARSGIFVGLSSMADAFRSKGAPAYAASKAGMTSYLEGVARAVQDTGVHVVNVRLGFVNTKMAKGDAKLWMIEPEVAAERILNAVLAKSPPRRLNIPRRTATLTRLLSWISG